jgi:hypothetical protein
VIFWLQFTSRTNLNLPSMKPLFRVQLQGATTIFIIVACLWVGYLPDALLSTTHCFKYIASEMYNVVYSVCAVLKEPISWIPISAGKTTTFFEQFFCPKLFGQNSFM